MGALEAKKFPLFSEWQMERCSECVAYHSELGAQLENPLSGREVARARANDRKVETLGKTTWKISSTAGDVQKELVTFLMTYNGNCAQAPLTLQACWGGDQQQDVGSLKTRWSCCSSGVFWVGFLLKRGMPLAFSVCRFWVTPARAPELEKLKIWEPCAVTALNGPAF